MSAKEYLKLPYSIVIRRVADDSGVYYFATVSELDGCMSDGDTLEEAYANIQEAMEGWIETKLEAGFPVPVPGGAEKPGGKYEIRLPKSLHERLMMEAEREGVSLSQYTLYKLSV